MNAFHYIEADNGSDWGDYTPPIYDPETLQNTIVSSLLKNILLKTPISLTLNELAQKLHDITHYPMIQCKPYVLDNMERLDYCQECWRHGILFRTIHYLRGITLCKTCIINDFDDQKIDLTTFLDLDWNDLP